MSSQDINYVKTSQSSSTNGVESSTAAKSCICSFLYEPVCAQGHTFDNACIANCNGITQFAKGACNCNTNSGEICAKIPEKFCPDGSSCPQLASDLQTFNNECEMVWAKATFQYMGSCK